MAALASPQPTQPTQSQPQIQQPRQQPQGTTTMSDARHREPEKPLVYEPPDLHGRKHVEKSKYDFLFTKSASYHTDERTAICPVFCRFVVCLVVRHLVQDQMFLSPNCEYLEKFGGKEESYNK